MYLLVFKDFTSILYYYSSSFVVYMYTHLTYLKVNKTHVPYDSNNSPVHLDVLDKQYSVFWKAGMNNKLLVEI